MAVVMTAKSTKARMILSAGTDPVTGKSLTKNVWLTNLRGNPDGTKLMNVVALAGPVLEYPVSGVETTEVKIVENA